MRWRLALLVSSLLVSAAQADIPVPDPPALFERGQEPSGNTIVAAGAAISAIVVALGLVVARWQTKASVGWIVVAAVSGAVLLAVWGIAGGAIWQANRDRGLWKQWEIDESNRRSNWRGPPDNFSPAPVPPPAPESGEPAPPTDAPEPLQ